MDDIRRGRPLAVDNKAESTSPTEPAFIARPEGAPVYHGFIVLDDVTLDGFTLGKITDWEAEPCETGDAFVIAPDGSRAGLVWEVCDPPYFQEVLKVEVDRWGVWGVGFRLPMNSRKNALENLKSIQPQLKLPWVEWKSRFQGAGGVRDSIEGHSQSPPRPLPPDQVQRDRQEVRADNLDPGLSSHLPRIGTSLRGT